MNQVELRWHREHEKRSQLCLFNFPMKYTFVGNWYLKKVNIWVLKNNEVKIDYKQSIGWMEAISNILSYL